MNKVSFESGILILFYRYFGLLDDISPSSENELIASEIFDSSSYSSSIRLYILSDSDEDPDPASCSFLIYCNNSNF